jgi:hypothetical protein
MNGGKKMRVALGSLYVLNKPISANEHGAELLTNAFEILVVMSVGFSKAGSMVFYVIAIRKCSLFRRLGDFFKKLRKKLCRMADVNQPFLTYSMGMILNAVINIFLKVVRYYYRESEIIRTLRFYKNNISEIIKDIRKDIRKDPNICAKLQEPKLVGLIKNNIDKIIRAMLTNRKATISIKRKHLLLFESHLWCDSLDVAGMKWHEIGRMMDIEQWPMEAIRLWARHQLCLPPESFEELIENLCFFNDVDEAKKTTIEYIQRNNVSKRSVQSMKGANKPRPDVHEPLFTIGTSAHVEGVTNNDSHPSVSELLNTIEDDFSDEEFYDRDLHLRRKKKTQLHETAFGR